MSKVVWRGGQAVTITDEEFQVPTAEEILQKERSEMVASRMQAKIALSRAGLLTSAQAIVDAADAETELAWNEALEFRRFSPTILALQGAMSLTDTALDDLFRVAMSIEK